MAIGKKKKETGQIMLRSDEVLVNIFVRFLHFHFSKLPPRLRRMADRTAGTHELWIVRQ